MKISWKYLVPSYGDIFLHTYILTLIELYGTTSCRGCVRHFFISHLKRFQGFVLTILSIQPLGKVRSGDFIQGVNLRGVKYEQRRLVRIFCGCLIYSWSYYNAFQRLFIGAAFSKARAPLLARMCPQIVAEQRIPARFVWQPRWIYFHISRTLAEGGDQRAALWWFCIFE